MRQPQGSRRDEAGGSRRGGALLRTALAVAVLFGVLPVSAASATPAPVQVGDAWIESHPIVSVDPESGVPRVVGRQDKRVFIAETVPGIEDPRPGPRGRLRRVPGGEERDERAAGELRGELEGAAER